MLELINITKVYSMGGQCVRALRGLSLSVQAGELLAIMGASGAGKSTLINIIGLLDRPTTGEYYLSGEQVSNATVKQRAMLRNQHIGFIFQSFFLLPKLTALQNVGLPLIYRGIPSPIIRKEAMWMLEKVEMARFSHHLPSELSGGQQQRVAIARALVGHPSIILADEPTGALDTKTGGEVLALLKQINKKQAATTIIITHAADIAAQCRRTVHIKDGALVEGVR